MSFGTTQLHPKAEVAPELIGEVMICRSDGGRGTSDSTPTTDEAAARENGRKPITAVPIASIHASLRIGAVTSCKLRATRKPRLLDELSGVFELRAATRYRLQ